MRPTMLITFAAASLALAAAFSTYSAPQAEGEEEATYVGSDTCKKCHFKQHRYWKKSPKYKSLDTLKPTTEDDNAELFAAKTAAGLDPAKDYSTDAKCLKCHTTAYGQKGGYPVDPAADAEAAEAMAMVGCESCHGAGSKYVEHKKAGIEKDKDAKFAFEDMAKFGLVQPNEEVCATCHNDDNPAKPATPFNFEEAKTQVHAKKK